MNPDIVDLSVRLGRLTLKNPVMPASGTFGYGDEFPEFLNLEDLGALIVKGTTLHPRLGSFQHRFAETSNGAFISSVGLQNMGVERFITDKLPYLRQFRTPVIVNIAGESISDFVTIAEALNHAEGVSGIEINLTCPNVKEGGVQFSANPDMTFGVVKSVRNVTAMTIISKYSPTVTDSTILARACEEAGSDAVCPNYTAVGMAIDIHTRRSKMGKNLMGAVGGPWKKPLAVSLVRQVAQAVHIPVIGCGGIRGPEDALEFFIVGATAVEIGTYSFINPRVTVETIEGIRYFLAEKGIKSITELIGTMENA